MWYAQSNGDHSSNDLLFQFQSQLDSMSVSKCFSSLQYTDYKTPIQQDFEQLTLLPVALHFPPFGKAIYVVSNAPLFPPGNGRPVEWSSSCQHHLCHLQHNNTHNQAYLHVR